MGNKPEARFDFIQERAEFVKDEVLTFKAGFGSAAQYETPKRRPAARPHDTFLVPPCSSMNCLGMTACRRFRGRRRQRTDRSRCT